MTECAHDRVSLLEDFVNHDEGFKRLDFVRQNRLHSEACPYGDGRVVVPRVHDAFCASCSSVAPPVPHRYTPTSDVLLLGRSLLWTRGLLNVERQLCLCLVAVHWSRREVDLVPVIVVRSRRPYELL